MTDHEAAGAGLPQDQFAQCVKYLNGHGYNGSAITRRNFAWFVWSAAHNQRRYLARMLLLRKGIETLVASIDDHPHRKATVVAKELQRLLDHNESLARAFLTDCNTTEDIERIEHEVSQAMEACK